MTADQRRTDHADDERDRRGDAVRDEGGRTLEGQVSEAGGSSLNAETTEGGADAVPDAHG